jgi:mevalonate pyrophosphate decarboxylase
MSDLVKEQESCDNAKYHPEHDKKIIKYFGKSSTKERIPTNETVSSISEFLKQKRNGVFRAC